MNAASYTYAVARPFDPEGVAHVRGIDGAALHLVRHEDLVAVVSPMPRAGAADALRVRLETLPELEALARAHHAVVEAVAARSVTLPLRLATVHHGDERLAEVLRRGYGSFCAALDRLAGRVELGVKAYLRDGHAAESTRSMPSTSGRDYLRRRRAQRDNREQARRRAFEAAQAVDAALAALAVDRRTHPAQTTPLAAAAGENILNVAYLVEVDRAATFTELARRLGVGSAEISVEVTGPWAPYSFGDRQESS